MNIKSRVRCVLPLLLVGIFLINIELTAVNLALSQIAQYFKVNISKTSSILSLYLAFFAVFAVVGGKLGDVLGRKRLVVVTSIIFILALIIGGCAKYYSWLLIARSLQGLSAGAMLPNYTALIYDSQPQQNKAATVGILSGVVGLATSVGPLFGALVTKYLGWRYIFYLNIPVSVVVLLGLFFFIDDKSIRVKANRIDFVGMLLTIAAILVLMKLLDVVPYMQFFSISIYLLSFVLCFSLWIWRHLQSPNAFLTVKLFRYKTYVLGCLFRMLLGFSYYNILYILGIFSQEVLHLKNIFAGAMYLPMTIMVALISIFYSWLAKKLDFTLLLKYALAVFSFVMLVLSFSLTSVVMMVVCLLVLGAAYGVLYSCLFTLTLKQVGSANTSEASGSLYFFNLVGGTIGVCVAGIIFSLHHSTSLNYTVFHAMHKITLVCSSLIFLCLVFSVFLLRRDPGFPQLDG